MINVRITTSLGDIVVEVYDDKAPRTAAYFMRCVDDGHYTGSTFYRAARAKDNQAKDKIKIDVIEGGFYNDYIAEALQGNLDPEVPFDIQSAPKPPYPPITLEPTNETGILHVDGALSLGRDTPDTVADDFFICVGAQPSLDSGGMRNPDGLGFPAFGKVIEGMDLVREIHGMPTDGQKLKRDVKILSITRVDQQ